MSNKISFQGAMGAFSHLACQKYFPELSPLACDCFEDAFAAVRDGAAKRAMIPVENTLAGRVSDIHALLPDSDLQIVAEKFLPIHHQLLAHQNASLETIKQAHSHPMALGQCRASLQKLGIKPANAYDTAGAAKILSQGTSIEDAAIASSLAGKIYGLQTLAANIEDAAHNTTRFLIMARRGDIPEKRADTAYMTSFIFEVRNIPGALYKVMGAFATNGVNMTKLESYQLGGSFTATRFFCDITGHPSEAHLAGALDEVAFFCTNRKIVGVYEADPFRKVS